MSLTSRRIHRLYTLTCDANNDKRLTRKDREDNSAKDRCKQNLVHTKTTCRFCEHIEGECQSRQNAVKRSIRCWQQDKKQCSSAATGLEHNKRNESLTCPPLGGPHHGLRKEEDRRTRVQSCRDVNSGEHTWRNTCKS